MVPYEPAAPKGVLNRRCLSFCGFDAQLVSPIDFPTFTLLSVELFIFLA